MLCTARSGLPEPPAAGDWVEAADIGGGRGRITAVLPRRNALTRVRTFSGYGRGGHGSGLRQKREQVVAANIDQILLVFAAARPHLNLDKVDEALLAAAAADLPALPCINKSDLAEAHLPQHLEPYRRPDLPLFVTSAVEDLPAALRGRTTALWGPSGTGKTSLLNRLEPGLGLRVQAVSAGTGGGRHTTTAATLCRCGADGWVVDSPGWRHIRADAATPAALRRVFPEVAAIADTCRYSDCRHRAEPGSAVRVAIAAGRVQARRAATFARYASVWAEGKA